MYKIMRWVIISIVSICVLYFVMKKIKENLLPYDPKIDELKRKLLMVHSQASSIKFYHDKKSYTINKQEIYLCIKDESGDYYEENMLMYAALHELAHVLCDEIGHTDKYWAIFDDVLEKASKIIDPKTNKPIYDPNGKINKNYCESKYHNS
jgi:hypothetical protein